jgi:hypothetical protein
MLPPMSMLVPTIPLLQFMKSVSDIDISEERSNRMASVKQFKNVFFLTSKFLQFTNHNPVPLDTVLFLNINSSSSSSPTL